MIKKVNVEIRIKEVNSNNNYPTMLFWSCLLLLEIFNYHTTTKKQE